MALRTAIPNIGSVEWIANEQSDAFQKESDHFEDFALAVRNEFEWLNEHMSEVFAQGSRIDITELYKTPGKLRGKTPRHPRKLALLDDNPDNNDDVFAPKSSTLATQHKPTPSQTAPLSAEPVEADQNARTLAISPSPATTPDLVRDSGCWSNSSGPASLAGSFNINTVEAVQRISPAKKPSYEIAPRVIPESAEQRSFSETSRKSFHSAPEEPSVPLEDADQEDQVTHLNLPNPDLVSTKTSIVVQNLPNSASLYEVSKEVTEDRSMADHKDGASGEVSLVTSPLPVTSSTRKLSSSIAASPKSAKAIIVSPIQIDSSGPPSPISPIAPTATAQTPRQSSKEQGAESDTPSDAPSPATGLTRSSINFAALPARETLTHKKSMGGANATSRSSHLDDRASFFGRLTNGKSFGITNNFIDSLVSDQNQASLETSTAVTLNGQVSDDEDDDDDLNEQLRLAELNKASVTQLSEKTSTQRLNEKISQLNSQTSTRQSKSIPASSFTSVAPLTGNELPIKSDEASFTGEAAAVLSIPSKIRDSIQSDDEDWIPSRPQFPRSHTEPSAGPSPQGSPIRLVSSPKRIIPGIPLIEKPPLALPRSINHMGPSPTKLPMAINTPAKSAIAAPHIAYPPLPSETRPKGDTVNNVSSSVPKSTADPDISTVKKTQAGFFSAAKQLLFRTARNESPKLQTTTPKLSPQKVLPFMQRATPSVEDLSKKEQDKLDNSTQVQAIADQPLYPELVTLEDNDSLSNKTRSMKLIEDLQNSQALNLVASSKIGGKLAQANLISLGNTEKRDVQLKGPSPDAIEGIALVHEHADDGIHSPVVSDNTPSLPASPFSDLASQEDYNDEDSDVGFEVETLKSKHSGPAKTSRRKSSPKSTRQSPTKQSRLQEPQSRASFLAKPTEAKKPAKGLLNVKDGGISKHKPGPTNIRLATASQREMDQRKNGMQIPVPTSTLVNALAESFGPLPAKETVSRPPSALSTSSSQNLRAPKSIAALTAAAKAQKKEQDERERKATQKQEIERRRQENLRRIEAQRDDERKQNLKGKKLLEKPSEEDVKKRLVTTKEAQRSVLSSAAKVLPKVNTYSQAKALPNDRDVAAAKSQPDLKRQPKRLFQTERDDKILKDEKASQVANQPESKRRKTEDVIEFPAQSAFAPPIRQSTAKKENMPPSSKIGGIFSQDYTPAPVSHFGASSSLVKSTLQQSLKTGMNAGGLPKLDAVKFSHDQLRFGTMVTPAPQRSKKPQSISQESPIYPNPESIELPEINTDSEDDYDEDEDDDHHKKKSFKAPTWADSPELRKALLEQLGIDPVSIFGPVATLQMDDIFKAPRDRAKFRARTSSANWSGADRLTAAEIEADRIERNRILENGGWTYQKPN